MTGYTPNIEIDGAEISRQIKAAYADQLHKSSNFFLMIAQDYFILFYFLIRKLYLQNESTKP